MTESDRPVVRELTPLEYLQVQARKRRQAELIRERGFIEKPEPIGPDAICFAYDKPKHAFFTEGKAYKALVVVQQRRAADGKEKVEKRFYRCPFPRALTRISGPHFHLTSMSIEQFEQEHPAPDQEHQDVHQD